MKLPLRQAKSRKGVRASSTFCGAEKLPHSTVTFLSFPTAGLAPTRWQLRDAVKVVNQMLATLKLEKHRNVLSVRTDHSREDDCQLHRQSISALSAEAHGGCSRHCA